MNDRFIKLWTGTKWEGRKIRRYSECLGGNLWGWGSRSNSAVMREALMSAVAKSK